jgi:hypothetical protein
MVQEVLRQKTRKREKRSQMQCEIVNVEVVAVTVFFLKLYRFTQNYKVLK